MSDIDFANFDSDINNYWSYSCNNQFLYSYIDEPRQNIAEEQESNDFYDNSKSLLAQDDDIPEPIFHEDLKKIVTGTDTEPTSFLTKRERNKFEDYQLQKQDEIEQNNIYENIFDINEQKEKDKKNEIKSKDLKEIKILIKNNDIPKGRRRENCIYDEEPKHIKFVEDNIIRKIKTFIFKYILNLLNNSLNDETQEFYPLESELNENLKKDLNEQLLNRTIRDIYENSKLNERHQDKPDANKNLIKKIFDEKTELETIKILSMTYRDILEQIRKKDSFNFLEEIRKKEKNKKKNTPQIINFYLEKLKKLLDNYEGWFNNKLGRNTEKRKKNKVKKI